jgi:ribonuclease P protein component
MSPALQSPLPKLPAEVSHAGSTIPSRSRDARLRKHADYQRVYQSTRKQFSASMTWFVSAREVSLTSNAPVTAAAAAGPRVGLTAGKVLGKAHERNRIKRRMREAVRRHILELPDGVDLVLHPRRSVMTMEFVKLEAEVLRIFRQAGAQIRQRTIPDASRPRA